MNYPSGYSEPPTTDDIFEAGAKSGRQEMLWLMAIGAIWSSWQAVERHDGPALVLLAGASVSALQTLSELGDKRASELLVECHEAGQ